MDGRCRSFLGQERSTRHLTPIPSLHLWICGSDSKNRHAFPGCSKCHQNDQPHCLLWVWSTDWIWISSNNIILKVITKQFVSKDQICSEWWHWRNHLQPDLETKKWGKETCMGISQHLGDAAELLKHADMCRWCSTLWISLVNSFWMHSACKCYKWKDYYCYDKCSSRFTNHVVAASLRQMWFYRTRSCAMFWISPWTECCQANLCSIIVNVSTSLS